MVNPAEFFREVAIRGRDLPLSDCEDEELVERAQAERDKEACEYLLYKYRNLVRAKVKSYFLMGAERDDLLQIGMVGLWEAINDFRPDRLLCMFRQGMHTAPDDIGGQGSHAAEASAPQFIGIPGGLTGR
jgi:hypothetical protein